MADITSVSSLLLLVAVGILRNQWEHNKLIIRREFNQEYDFIIIGGGAAGSVVAYRLSENTSQSVLLIEAGGAAPIESDIPAMAPLLRTYTKYDWNYMITPQEASCFAYEKNRLMRYHRGKVLGGGTTINAMASGRGSIYDYQQWAKEGAHNWSWENVLPFFIKLENNTDLSIVANASRGFNGPIQLSSVKRPSLLGRVFLDAAKSLGYKEVERNELVTTGFTMPQLSIGDGRRCSTEKGYLQAALKFPNLHIMANAEVQKIMFDDNKTAINVSVMYNGIIHSINAKKEIILSAGAINSPFLLMKSGIGPKDELSKFNIQIIKELSVGKNYQDHVLTDGISFTTNLSSPDSLFTWTNIKEYFLYRKGNLTLFESPAVYVKSKYMNDTKDWPDIQLLLFHGTPAGYLNKEDALMNTGMRPIVWDAVYKPYVKYNTISIVPVLNRPKSRGWIKLIRENGRLKPEINPQFLTDKDDLNVIVEGMKFAYEMANSKPFKLINVQPFKTVFPQCKSYYKQSSQIPSDDYLRCISTVMTNSLRHGAGSCKMGNDNDSVVDFNLKVHGVKGLRVIDASIFPHIVSGFSALPTIMVGEKGSQMIKDEYNL